MNFPALAAISGNVTSNKKIDDNKIMLSLVQCGHSSLIAVIDTTLISKTIWDNVLKTLQMACHTAAMAS